MTAPKMSVQTDNGRAYIHPVHKNGVSSITTIKSVKGIDAVEFMMARDATSLALDHYEAWSTMTLDDAAKYIHGLLEADKDDPKRPANIGNVVHDWVDRYIKNEGEPDGEDLQAAPITCRRMWDQFMMFANDGYTQHGMRFVDSEFTVWSYAYGYAGTADGACWYDEKLTLFDTKTGKKIYSDMALQLAPLVKADVILRPDGREITLPKFADARILHLRPKSWQFQEVCPPAMFDDEMDAAFTAFRALKAVHEWMSGHSRRLFVSSV